MRIRATGHRRRAECVSRTRELASEGRTLDQPCPTWFGDGDLDTWCDGNDVESWWLELESRVSLVDSFEKTKNPSAADKARIASFRSKIQTANELSMLGVDCEMMASAGIVNWHTLGRDCVSALMEAVSASYCVTDLWEGAGQTGGQTGGQNGGQPGGQKKGSGGYVETPAKDKDRTLIGVAAAFAIGIVAFALGRK